MLTKAMKSEFKVEISGYDHEDDRVASKAICCPSCYSLFLLPELKEEVCPCCGFTMKEKNWKYLARMASESAELGYNMREVHELESQDVGYSLAPVEQGLVFLAGWVVANIMQGITYDTFKIGISRLTNRRKGEIVRKVVEGMTDKELRKFYEYVSEYYLWRVQEGKIEDKHDEIRKKLKTKKSE